jgi:methylsterol monooxygenase
MHNNTLRDSFSTSFEELNFIEKAWANYFNSFENEVIATALIAFFMHEIVYFGRCVPFIIADCIPSFAKYKLQPVSKQVKFFHFLKKSF